MFENVKHCTRCPLHSNQKPLLDTCTDSDVIWVGLSAKKANDIYEVPLSSRTMSGQLIGKIESSYSNISYYKTNLVKCLPLNDFGNLRYPTKKEMDACLDNLIYEIKSLKPKLVFLLGSIVGRIVLKHFNFDFNGFNGFKYGIYKVDSVIFVPVHHPAYISTYKRKHIDNYKESIAGILELFLIEGDKI